MDDDYNEREYRKACQTLSVLYWQRSQGVYDESQQTRIFLATEREKNLRGRQTWK